MGSPLDCGKLSPLDGVSSKRGHPNFKRDQGEWKEASPMVWHHVIVVALYAGLLISMVAGVMLLLREIGKMRK
jgi:hypothetical protein